jgi:hypothetical protein
MLVSPWNALTEYYAAIDEYESGKQGYQGEVWPKSQQQRGWSFHCHFG